MDEPTYTGQATLTIADAEPIPLHVDLHVSIEREPGAYEALRSWSGTATTDHAVPMSGEQGILTLPDGRTGNAYLLEADNVLEIQGVGPAPWWSGTEA